MGTSTKAQTRRALAARDAKKKVDPDNFEPIVITPSTEPAEEIHLFSITDDEGKVQEYWIPKKVKFNITLRATEILAEQGEYAAGVFILKTLLGDEGYQALKGCEDVTKEQFEQICEVAEAIVLGPKEGKAR